MLALDETLVKLGQKAKSKDDAIRQVAAILSGNGAVDPRYEGSMFAREKQTATYLGNGIAIPHGLRGDGHLIKRTAIAVAQFPEGVVWADGEKVFLVIGIAAKSDEHIQVLANLTGVLQDNAAAQLLAHTTRKADIVLALTREASRSNDSTVNDASFDHAADVMIMGHAGLHARPATAFAALAKSFESEVRVRFAGKVANGKAMSSLLTLGAEHGSVVRILTRGQDAEAALLALEQGIKDGLGEGPGESDDFTPLRSLDYVFKGDVRKGVAAAPGMAVAEAFILEKKEIHIEEKAGRYQDERNKLLSALMAARQELLKLISEVSAQSGSQKAAIFLAHQDIIDDPDLLEEVNHQLKEGFAAGVAFKRVMERRAEELANLKNERLADRAQDVRDVLDRVLRVLAGGGGSTLMKRLPADPVILIADDLAPSDTATLDPKRVLGLITATGGPNSHTAILARALGLPSVVGIGPKILEVSGRLIIDGDGGVVVVNPDESDLSLAQTVVDTLQKASANAKREAYRPAVTRDGKRVETVANIGAIEEARTAVEGGAEGVGLLRTEFFFLKRTTAPSEDEQFQSLLSMSRTLRGLPLVVRTLDIGGDKEVPYLQIPKEENPFLGVRGIRLCLEHPELFEPQLRAIVRVALVSEPGAIKVMFPMIATVEEFILAKAMLEKIRHELKGPAIECGIMVEVPSAAMIADHFAEVVDFFSIGTNDLTQYVLAMDRLHPSLAKQADGLHPAVLRMIKMVVDAAHKKGRWVGVCGNLAAERIACPILVGLGVDELSVSPPAVAELKARIRELTLAGAQRLANKALQCRSAEEVRRLI